MIDPPAASLELYKGVLGTPEECLHVEPDPEGFLNLQSHRFSFHTSG